MAATNDAIDALVARLNTIDGIDFVRDAWINKAPEDYGVVEFQGDVAQLWADGHLVDSVWHATVVLYIRGDSDRWPGVVAEKLRELEDEGDIDISARVARRFDIQTGKVAWTWRVSLYGSLITEEGPEEDPDPEDEDQAGNGEPDGNEATGDGDQDADADQTGDGGTNGNDEPDGNGGGDP